MFPDENIVTVVPNVSVAEERKIARDVKENPCHICLVFDTEHKSTADSDNEKTCELPDGNVSTVGVERFRCVEVVFWNPRHFFPTHHEESCGAKVLFQSNFTVNKPAKSTTLLSELRRGHPQKFVCRVLLSSGTTMFKETVERMTKKPTELPPPTTKIKVVAPPERQYSVRIGGSILFFQHIPADVDLEGEYDGSGPTIVHRKCF